MSDQTKIQLNEYLNAWHKVLPFFLVIAIAGVSAWIFEKERQELHRAEGLKEAAGLALLLSDEAFIFPEVEVRGPASINNSNGQINNSLEKFLEHGESGEIGEDPWGQPFLYRIVEDETGFPSHILVWSRGPDQFSSLKKELFRLAKRHPTSEFLMDGDDFGYVYRLAP